MSYALIFYRMIRFGKRGKIEHSIVLIETVLTGPLRHFAKLLKSTTTIAHAKAFR